MKDKSKDSEKPGRRRRFNPWDSFSGMAKSGLYMPLLFSFQALDLGGELARIITGRSTLSPDPKDARFKDPAWQKNPVYKASMQAYLAWCRSLETAIDESGLSDKEKEEARKAYKLLSQQASNQLTSSISQKNPGQEFKSRGASLIQSAQLLSEEIQNRELPKHFTIGKDLATTPGQVVLTTPQTELIQYHPVTAKVRQTPILMVPSPLHRYYIFDLKPENSLIRYLLEQGYQVFTLSWFNPNRSHKHWNMTDYGNSLIECMRAVGQITGSSTLNLFGLAAGGLIASMVAGTKEGFADVPRIKSLTLVTSGFDPRRFSTRGSAMPPQLFAATKTLARCYGTIDANRMSELYAWARPNSLTFNSRVFNYFSSQERPTAEIQYWNTHSPHIPAALHCDFLDLFRSNGLMKEEGIEFLDHNTRMMDIKCPVYSVAGANDYICPWEIVYANNQIINGKTEFVLTNQDHARTLVCPPGTPGAIIYTNDEQMQDAEDWLNESNQHESSWWPHWQAWLNRHSGKLTAAPETLGSKQFPPSTPAPGHNAVEPSDNA